jgi:Type III restriction enzyme, res subunit
MGSRRSPPPPPGVSPASLGRHAGKEVGGGRAALRSSGRRAGSGDTDERRRKDGAAERRRGAAQPATAPHARAPRPEGYTDYNFDPVARARVDDFLGRLIPQQGEEERRRSRTADNNNDNGGADSADDVFGNEAHLQADFAEDAMLPGANSHSHASPSPSPAHGSSGTAAASAGIGVDDGTGLRTISRRQRLEWDAKCNKTRAVLRPNLPAGTVFDERLHCMELVAPDPKKLDRLGLVYTDASSKLACDQVGGQWYSDPALDERGIDVCFVKDTAHAAKPIRDKEQFQFASNVQCITKTTELECHQAGCTRVPPGFEDVFGPLSGRCVSAEPRRIKELLRGRLPPEWPVAYDRASTDGRTAVNMAVKAFFDGSMSTLPMNARAPTDKDDSRAAREAACNGRGAGGDITKLKPSQHQAVVYTIMQGLARPGLVHPGHQQHLHPGGAPTAAALPRGILAWHSTGAGKTAIAAGVAEAFWRSTCPSDRARPRPIIYLCTPAGLLSNPPENFALEARRFFKPDWRDEWVAARAQSAHDVAQVETKQQSLMATGYQASDTSATPKGRGRMVLMSYEQFANRLALEGMTDLTKKDPTYARDAVLIIDEVHNLLSPKESEAKVNQAVLKWLLSRTPETLAQQGDLKVVVMTATPGDNVAQLTKLLRVVQCPARPPIEVPLLHDARAVRAFQDSIYGLVSYINLSLDVSRFPRLKEVPVDCPLGANHAAEYAKKLQDLANAVARLNVEIRRLIRESQRKGQKHGMHTFESLEAFAFMVVAVGTTAAGSDADDADGGPQPGEREVPERSGDARWFNVNEGPLREWVKKAVDAYRDARKWCTWANIVKDGGMDTLQYRGEPRDKLRTVASYSAKTARFIGLLLEDKPAAEAAAGQPRRGGKHYAYAADNQGFRSGIKWMPGIQATAHAMEQFGYRRLYVGDVKALIAALHVPLPDSNGKKSKAAAAPGGHGHGHGEVTDPARAHDIVVQTLAARWKESPERLRGARFYTYLLSTELLAAPKQPGKKDATTDAQKSIGAALVRALFNCAANRHGDVVHVCLASQKFNESIDLQGVQHLHILQPLLSATAETQTLGRAQRNCSHAQLGYDVPWEVRVYHYRSVLPAAPAAADAAAAKGKAPPKLQAPKDLSEPDKEQFLEYAKRLVAQLQGGKTIDHVVEAGKRDANRHFESVLNLVRAQAVDCRLFGHFHGIQRCGRDAPSSGAESQEAAAAVPGGAPGGQAHVHVHVHRTPPIRSPSVLQEPNDLKHANPQLLRFLHNAAAVHRPAAAAAAVKPPQQQQQQQQQHQQHQHQHQHHHHQHAAAAAAAPDPGRDRPAAAHHGAAAAAQSPRKRLYPELYRKIQRYKELHRRVQEKKKRLAQAQRPHH